MLLKALQCLSTASQNRECGCWLLVLSSSVRLRLEQIMHLLQTFLAGSHTFNVPVSIYGSSRSAYVGGTQNKLQRPWYLYRRKTSPRAAVWLTDVFSIWLEFFQGSMTQRREVGQASATLNILLNCKNQLILVLVFSWDIMQYDIGRERGF